VALNTINQTKPIYMGGNMKIVDDSGAGKRFVVPPPLMLTAMLLMLQKEKHFDWWFFSRPNVLTLSNIYPLFSYRNL
jgi:hypothetical protein